MSELPEQKCNETLENNDDENENENDECAKTPTLKELEEDFNSSLKNIFGFCCGFSVGIGNNDCTKIIVDKFMALLKERENELEAKNEAGKVMEKEMECKIKQIIDDKNALETKLKDEMTKLEEENKKLKQEFIKATFDKYFPSATENLYLLYSSDGNYKNCFRCLYATHDRQLKLKYGSPNLSSFFKFCRNIDGTFGIYSTIKEKFLEFDQNSNLFAFTGTIPNSSNGKFELRRQEIQIASDNKYYFPVQIRALANDQFFYVDQSGKFTFSNASKTFFIVFADA